MRYFSIVLTVVLILQGCLPVLGYAENSVKDIQPVETVLNPIVEENSQTESIKQEIKNDEKTDIKKESVKESKTIPFGEKYNKTPKTVSNFKMPKGILDEADEVKMQLAGSKSGFVLEPKTSGAYEIVLAHDNGDYTFVASADSYEKAIEEAKNVKNKYRTNDSMIPAVINKDGKTVYATQMMGKVVKYVNGAVDPTSGNNSNVYLDSNLKSNYTYINHGYIKDVPVIEANASSAKVEVSGLTGWMNRNVKDPNRDLDIIPINQATNPSRYYINDGKLRHFITSDLTASKNSNSGYVRTIGPAPSYLKKDVNYYSYDGNYFYTSLSKLISDAKNGNHNNAVNGKNPFYSYYLYLPFRSKTTYSAAQINNFIDSNVSSWENRYGVKSKLRGIGQNLINAQETFGVNALMILSVAINESRWGTSNNAQIKNNLFGIGVFDSAPENGDKYATVGDSVNAFAKHYISTGYADPEDWRYFGGHLGNKYLGANVKYASDPYWGEKAAEFVYNADVQLSGKSKLKDYNNDQLAINTTANEVVDSKGNLLYSISSNQKNDTGWTNTPFIVSSSNKVTIKGKDHYEIIPLRTTSITQGPFDGNFNWGKKAYTKTSGVKFINKKTGSNDSNDNNNSSEKISYTAHVQDIGWMNWVSNGGLGGTTGKAKRVEGIRIKLDNLPAGASVKYRTHVQDYGWMNWVKDGAVSGTEGKSKRAEGIQIKLEGAPAGYHVEYRVHVQDYGWQNWVRDGEVAGSVGRGKRLEALEIRLVKDKQPSSTGINVSYTTHLQDYGWLKKMSNGQSSGILAEGKRMEAIKLNLTNAPAGMKIKYRGHVQDQGWQKWVGDNQLAGTEGAGKRLEAIEIKLEGAPAGHKVEYRVYVEGSGWSKWVNNGQTAGTIGKSKRIENIEVRIVK